MDGTPPGLRSLSMSQTTFCKRHSSVETSIACGRCGDAICPRCMVHAPVGVRCLDCGRSRPAPTFDVSPMIMARGIGAGLVVGIVGGVLASIVVLFVSFPYLLAILIVGLGYLVGEAISLSTNRKRGVRLKLAAGLCMFIGYSLITFLTDGMTFNLTNLLAGGIGFYLSINKF